MRQILRKSATDSYVKRVKSHRVCCL